MQNNPPCASWTQWTGREVEGHTGIGKITLFARGGDVWHTYKTYKLKFERVWLCKEFLYGHDQERLTELCMHLADDGVEVAVEVPLSQLSEYMYLRAFVRFYIKWEVDLLDGDHICIGHPFNDESHVVGFGRKMFPSDYTKDVKIL